MFQAIALEEFLPPIIHHAINMLQVKVKDHKSFYFILFLMKYDKSHLKEHKKSELQTNIYRGTKGKK